MFLTFDQCNERNCGNKAFALAALSRHGFRVPPFLVLGFDNALNVLTMDVVSDEDATLVRSVIGDGPYAVRSALSGEDSLTRSMAGQFVTVLNVKAADLLATLKDVITENARRAPQMKQSIIVQRCLAPETSGVVFTRSPFDPFCLQIDEVTGLGEGLVSGQRDADSTYVARTQRSSMSMLAKIATEIEKLFGHPQDIEWSVEQGELFILQARPITSITTEEAKELSSIESALPHEDYEYIQNGYAELAPSADPFMVELLGSLFVTQGPVEKAYARFGIKGRIENPITVIGNTVFSDSKKEQSLFQSGWRKFFNQAKFASAKKRYQITLLELKEKITSFDVPAFEKVDDAYAFVLREYETVFAANIVASSLDASAQFGLKALASPASVNPALSVDEAIPPPVGLVGNGFSLYDQTVFHPRTFAISEDGVVKGSVTEQYQYQAFQADVIREYGRWYAIQLMNVLRESIRVHQPEALAVPTMQRIVTLPRRLSTASRRLNEDELLSAGDAEGLLVNKESVSNITDPILATERLTPDLAEYLPRIKGVVTMVGSSLSHFAILARESGIPVLRVTRLPEGSLGKRVKIHAGKLLVEPAE